MSGPDGFETLANAALEGTATTAQRAELDARLAVDPEARDRWESLNDAFRELAEVRPEPPPPALAAGVMRAIRLEQAEAADRRKHSWLTRAFLLRLASAFAAGCVMGVVVVSAMTGWRPGMDGRAAGGTMMPMGAASEASAALTIASARAALEVRGEATGLGVRIEASGPEGSTLVLETEPSMDVEALDRMHRQPGRVSLAPGRVTLEFTGSLECTVRFHRATAEPTALRVTLRSGTEAVQKELRLSRPRSAG